jgi:glycerophosphoryl diester phosphodiesterase
MIPPVRIAHRGASGEGLAPENTLAAFEMAIQIGVDVLELDVHASRDGEIVVLHDATLDRTTDRQGLVREQSLAEVRRADAGSWFNSRYRGERVPTLAEVLDLARHRALVLIEVKADFISERLLGVVADMSAESQIIIQSFNPQTVQRIKLLNPSIPTSLLVGKLPTSPSRVRARRLVKQILQVGANALSVWHATLTPPFFEEMRKRAIGVWAWTVDEEIIMRDLALMGIQGIITDYPDRLNRVFEELEQEEHIRPPLGRRQRIRKSRWGRRRQLKKLRSSSQSR